MKAIILVLMVVSVAGMTTKDCTEQHFKTIRKFFSGVVNWPFNMERIVNALKMADDWQVCEHHLIPRVCVLHYVYEQAINRFRTADEFETKLKQIAYLAKAMEDKCSTRNMAPGAGNNL